RKILPLHRPEGHARGTVRSLDRQGGESAPRSRSSVRTVTSDMTEAPMGERIWDKYLTERDKQVFAASGYGARGGFGERPALLVVDVNYGFVGDKPEPILESIKRWMNSCGEDGWKAVAVIKQLVAAARQKGVPIIYTTGVRRDDGWDQGAWAYKNNRVTSDYMGL